MAASNLGAMTDEEATREAWTAILRGFDAALAVEGLPSHERARLVRCWRSCALKIGRPPLRTVNATAGGKR